jgi:magnesium-protoporphyrin IX monomethyl ester (oxidative) cyclase
VLCRDPCITHHAISQSQPSLLQGTVAKLWTRFFCLTVYVTMYLNDHQRSAFYEALGLNTTQVRASIFVRRGAACAVCECSGC